jgi:hypothetical protein
MAVHQREYSGRRDKARIPSKSVFLSSEKPTAFQQQLLLKGIVQPFELGGETRLIRSTVKTEGLAIFVQKFHDTISREEHKTIQCGLRISGMALFNQSDLSAFFSPPNVNFKIPINSGLRQI